jgi:hypothetical protein
MVAAELLGTLVDDVDDGEGEAGTVLVPQPARRTATMIPGARMHLT